MSEETLVRGGPFEPWDLVTEWKVDTLPGGSPGYVSRTDRLAVPGGWLYRTMWTWQELRVGEKAPTFALAFVPAPAVEQEKTAPPPPPRDRAITDYERNA